MSCPVCGRAGVKYNGGVCYRCDAIEDRYPELVQYIKDCIAVVVERETRKHREVHLHLDNHNRRKS